MSFWGQIVSVATRIVKFIIKRSKITFGSDANGERCRHEILAASQRRCAEVGSKRGAELVDGGPGWTAKRCLLYFIA
jgi:hypothetical protein